MLRRSGNYSRGEFMSKAMATDNTPPLEKGEAKNEVDRE